MAEKSIRRFAVFKDAEIEMLLDCVASARQSRHSGGQKWLQLHQSLMKELETEYEVRERAAKEKKDPGLPVGIKVTAWILILVLSGYLFYVNYR